MGVVIGIGVLAFLLALAWIRSVRVGSAREAGGFARGGAVRGDRGEEREEDTEGEAEKENKLETVRKRYRCEDYMETQELKLQAMERANESDGNKEKEATQPA